MIKRYSLFVSTIFLLNVDATAQYCTAVGPTTDVDSGLQSFYLVGESATAINFIGCPGVVGLDDQTFSQSVVLSAGSNYTAQAGFGTCGNNYYGVGEAWIDYNQNQIFEPSESMGTWAGTPPVAASNWFFNVPTGALTGITRMRVVQYENGALPIDPCSSFSWGSTTDFTVQIGGGIDCSPYVGESLTDPRLISTMPYTENYNNSICYYNVLTVYNSPDVFYRILPIALGVDFLTVSLCGSTIDTYLSILNADGNVLWYNDDFSACGTSSQITFACSTLDTVYLAVQGWGNVSGDYKIAVEQTFSGIDETDAISASIFPNPATNHFTVSANRPGNVTFYDLTGKMVYRASYVPYQVIDVSSLRSGTYLVKIQNESGQTTQKLVIE
jgi:Secretion system C-terminal sorting domain/GEVED domain